MFSALKGQAGHPGNRPVGHSLGSDLKAAEEEVYKDP